MSRRVLVHAGAVTCLVVCTAVPGRCQREALQTGGPFEVVKLYASDSQSVGRWWALPSSGAA